MRKNMLLLFFLCVGILSAQRISVLGTVKDGDKPMTALLVKSMQGKDSVLTDKNGYFLFKSVDVKDTLQTEIKGKTVLIPVDGNNLVNIKVKGDAVAVDRNKKEALASSYGGTMLTKAQLEQTGEKSLLKAISIKVAGVEYRNDNLTIRGTQSIVLDTHPLYLIDGVQSKDASYLQVFDVKSVEVLKGSEAAAFGVRGSNGVVIINTK